MTHTDRTSEHAEAIQKLGTLIKDIKFAMFTTRDHDSTLRSRPMATQQVEFDGDLWFFSGLSTEKIQELRDHPDVNVSYSEPSDQRYVSVSGTAEVVRDRSQMEKLWSPFYKAWFPKGLEDPDVCLIKVAANSAEYWDTPNGKMVQLFGLLKAVTTGKRYEAGKDEHDKLEIKEKEPDA